METPTPAPHSTRGLSSIDLGRLDPAARAEPAAMPATVGDITYDRLTDGSPEQFPEILRELTLLGGRLDGVHRLVDELADRTAHVCGYDTPRELLASVPFEVDTPVGRRVRKLYDELGLVEDRLAVMLRTLAV